MVSMEDQLLRFVIVSILSLLFWNQTHSKKIKEQTIEKKYISKLIIKIPSPYAKNHQKSHETTYSGLKESLWWISLSSL
jgi:hypothetical protein